MAQPTFPRRDQAHAITASQVLAKHEQAWGTAISLPVPIDMIVERTYHLNLDWQDIPEPAGTKILGALDPRRRCIVLNTRQESVLKQMGPYAFTLAHELGHWIYDADNPDQLSLDLPQEEAEVFCRAPGAATLAKDTQIREVNANKLAAHLLLPEHLVGEADIEDVVANFRATAARWGVSQQALRIRLDKLGLLDELDRTQLDLGW